MPQQPELKRLERILYISYIMFIMGDSIRQYFEFDYIFYYRDADLVAQD